MACHVTTEAVFHTPKLQNVQWITLYNSNGMKVTLSEFGASLIQVKVPAKPDDRQELVDLTLGYGRPELWQSNPCYMGVTAGRVANRINNASYELDGECVKLHANEGANMLHGGSEGFHAKRWLFQVGASHKHAYVRFLLLSPDGEMGFPGNVQAEVEYRLNNDNQLITKFKASSDKTTPISMTNHAYWNLADSKASGILGHSLWLNTDRYLPVSSLGIPTGEVLSVEDTPFDFQQEKAVGEQIAQLEHGYDHYLVVKEHSETQMEKVAVLTDPSSGRSVEITSTEPGLQFYTGGYFDGSLPERNGGNLSKFMGLCLETHGYPDAPNHDNFPSVMLTPEQEYKQITIYKFTF